MATFIFEVEFNRETATFRQAHHVLDAFRRAFYWSGDTNARLTDTLTDAVRPTLRIEVDGKRGSVVDERFHFAVEATNKEALVQAWQKKKNGQPILGTAFRIER